MSLRENVLDCCLRSQYLGRIQLYFGLQFKYPDVMSVITNFLLLSCCGLVLLSLSTSITLKAQVYRVHYQVNDKYFISLKLTMKSITKFVFLFGICKLCRNSPKQDSAQVNLMAQYRVFHYYSKGTCFQKRSIKCISVDPCHEDYTIVV